MCGCIDRTYRGGVRCLLVIPGVRERVITGSSDFTIRVWEESDKDDTYACMCVLTEHTSSVCCMTLSPSLLFSGSIDKTIRVWDINTISAVPLSNVYTLHGHTGGVRCIQLSWDCQRLYSGSIDHTIRVWDTSRTLLPSQFTCIHVLHGHSDWIKGILPVHEREGESVLYSSSFDKTIRVWNTRTYQCVNTLIGHSDTVLSMVIVHEERDSDGEKGIVLYTGSTDSTVKVWDLN